MSPEQATGQAIDARTDLYALGCLLYEILTLHPAFDPRDRELLQKVAEGKFIDVASREPNRPVPEPLAETCRRSMARDREARFSTASEMRESLRAWLDGRAERDRRRQEAANLVAQGEEAAEKYRRLKAAVAEAEVAAETEAAKYKPYQPIAEKRSVLEARQRVVAMKAEVAIAFAETTHLFSAALTQETGNEAAKAALAGLWTQQLREAERRGDPEASVLALAMAERYSDGPVASDGSLTLDSEPSGAEVLLYRCAEIDGVLTPGDEKPLGTTPLRSVPLPMGS
jgi:serine/threonine-protein kinase